MRDLILKMSMSVDGFVSASDGGNAWMFGTDPVAKAASVQELRDVGLHIMGSRTFRDMASWWPTSTDMFAAPMNQIPKAVFSRTGLTPTAANPQSGEDTAVQPGGESWTQAYVAGGDLADEIATMKAEDGKPVMAHGGVRFARSLIAMALVDQFSLWIAPVVLGQGLPLFSELAAPMRLILVRSRTFPGGAVAQTYRRA